MKKDFKFYNLIILCLILFILTGCGTSTGKDISEKTNETEVSFEDLVAQSDFPEAKAMMSKVYAPKVYDMADLLYGDWILEILASDDDNKTNKIIQLFGQYPIKGNKVEGLQSYYFNMISPLNPYKFEFNDDNDGWYSQGCSHFNQLCDKILNSAILMKNYDVAESIIELYMQDPEFTKGVGDGIIIDGKKIDGNHSYMKYSWKSKNAAKKKLNEAKKNK